MQFFNEASKLAACGFHVFPVRPGDHRAMLRNSATDDLAALSVLDRQMPDHDVGVLLGERSNLLVVEMEDWRSAREMAAREAVGQALPKCPVSVSKAGNTFAWFRNIAGVRGNQCIGMGRTVAGEGCFTLAPPAVDYWRGRLRWLVPPWEVRPPVAPDWLVAEIVARIQERGTFRNYATKREFR